ncbi:MAG: hypothetical protein WCQ21_13605 [Verrucomicrobiota bacterium]|jgi:hypothetical protein
MNEDLVEEERQKDAEQKNPEDRNVIEGPALQQLRDGTMMRDGRRYDALESVQKLAATQGKKFAVPAGT